jgi:hypothetical protein
MSYLDEALEAFPVTVLVRGALLVIPFLGTALLTGGLLLLLGRFLLGLGLVVVFLGDLVCIADYKSGGHQHRDDHQPHPKQYAPIYILKYVFEVLKPSHNLTPCLRGT